MYLITAKYFNDAERKRIEYILKQWENKIKIIKPAGITFFVDGEPDEIIKELMSKTGEDKISVFSLDETQIDIKKTRKIIEITFNEEINVVEKFTGFVMAKRKGVLKRETKTPFIKEYSIYTNKGGGEVSVKFSRNQQTNVYITIEAFEPAATYIHDIIKEDLEYFKKGI
ncbi:MAG: hypothetical protein A7315_13820 [Candidatus Altiarchaeales archaeon WOR_SM1_79]|nr:MAG: hypothetical protein A7315_13820 [Candidatus Altiarchaeales archaeon WOR_SM1_79]